MFPIWLLIRQSCVSKLAVNITFAPIFNLSDFARSPAFVGFLFWLSCSFTNGYLKLSGILSLLFNA